MYGGTFENAGCPEKVFFSLTVWVDEDGAVVSAHKGVLGVVNDKTLEENVIRAIVGIVDQFLGNRAQVHEPKS